MARIASLRERHFGRKHLSESHGMWQLREPQTPATQIRWGKHPPRRATEKRFHHTLQTAAMPCSSVTSWCSSVVARRRAVRWLTVLAAPGAEETGPTIAHGAECIRPSEPEYPLNHAIGEYGNLSVPRCSAYRGLIRFEHALSLNQQRRSALMTSMVVRRHSSSERAA